MIFLTFSFSLNRKTEMSVNPFIRVIYMTRMMVIIFIAIYHLSELDLSAAAPERTCKAIMSDITKRQMSGLSGCTKALKFKNGKEKAKKMNCIMKCALENEGLVSKTGEITQEVVDKLLIREFPDSLIPKANTTFQPCVQKFMGTLDANVETDPYCNTYDPLIKCLLQQLPQLCA